MKQKLISFFILVALIPVLCLNVSASSLPLIVDNGDLLTPEEESRLEQAAQSLRDDYDMDVVILTEDTLNGQSTESYAVAFYDGNGYGVGPDGSGLVLILVMDTREWYVSTCGDAVDAVPDSAVDDLFDVMSYDLSTGAYYDAFLSFLTALEDDFRDFRDGYVGYGSYDGHYNDPYGYYDRGYESTVTYRSSFGMGNVLISILIGLAAGGIVLLILRGMMNSKRPQRSAAAYMNRDSYHLRVHRDMFLYSRVHKTPRPKDNSGHHGGGGGGGGRRHGGGGGRF